MCFVWISEQTAIISLYSSNWLDFITETECVSMWHPLCYDNIQNSRESKQLYLDNKVLCVYKSDMFRPRIGHCEARNNSKKHTD
jgi:hypothetical protein